MLAFERKFMYECCPTNFLPCHRLHQRFTPKCKLPLIAAFPSLPPSSCCRLGFCQKQNFSKPGKTPNVSTFLLTAPSKRGLHEGHKVIFGKESAPANKETGLFLEKKILDKVKEAKVLYSECSLTMPIETFSR